MPAEDPSTDQFTALAQQLDELRRANELLTQRLIDLEGRTPSALAAPAVRSEEQPALETGNARLSRRGLLTTAGVGALAASAGFLIAKPAVARANSTVPVYTEMDFGPGTVSAPALSSDLVYTRTDPSGVGAGFTNEILSLISHNSQVNSYSWPLYIQLGVTTATAATQSSSQSCGASVRLFNSSAGSPWAVGFHSELHHGGRDDGTIHSTNATSIGYNMELNRASGGGTAIGMELLNTSGSTYPGTYGINIDGSWSTGIRLGGNSLAASSTVGGTGATPLAGSTAIKIEAPYETGIDLGPNHLRLQ
ncbi:MAG TPA: hypothetical protein VH298_16810, partial [Jatrophihabitans sp.]|nr:hypothetical protein [Jatrophihabitans sp.]